MVAIIDWYSRYILSWEIDDTLEISFVLDASKRALGNAHPTIMNSDQGSHFTSPKYTGLFLDAGSKISMDHRGRAYDNIFIEHFWRSLKYEDIYRKDYQYPREARKGIIQYTTSYPIPRFSPPGLNINDTVHYRRTDNIMLRYTSKYPDSQHSLLSVPDYQGTIHPSRDIRTYVQLSAWTISSDKLRPLTLARYRIVENGLLFTA